MRHTPEEIIEVCGSYLRYDGKAYFDMSKAKEYGITKEEILEQIDEIKAILKNRKKAEEEALKKEKEERERKLAAITGLKEIQAAYADMAKWYDEFSRSFEGEYACGGLGVRPKPNYDFVAMRKQYPIADAYLKAEEMAYKHNYELAAIGAKALSAILNDPEHYEDAMAQMEAENKEFVERHMWD